MSDHAIIIFGCAVLPDGRPSRALARRIGYGLRAARADPTAPILCSGFARKPGPSEAAVIGEKLAAAGVDPARLMLDEVSRDTLQSVAAAARLVRHRNLAGCTVCSDGYHIPRIRLCLAALGVATCVGPLGSGGDGLASWLGMALREVPAIPYDLALAWLKRDALLREPRSRSA